MKAVSAVWLIVAFVLVIGMHGGGENAVVSTLAYLAWTVPFGIVWHFLLYDALNFVSQIVGDVFVVAIAYIWWFVIVPIIFRWARRGISNPSS